MDYFLKKKSNAISLYTKENSFVLKMFTNYTNKVGLDYLKYLLKDLVEDIITDNEIIIEYKYY